MERFEGLWNRHAALRDTLTQIQSLLENELPTRKPLLEQIHAFETQLNDYRSLQKTVILLATGNRQRTRWQRLCAEHAWAEPRLVLKVMRLLSEEASSDNHFIDYELCELINRMREHLDLEQRVVLPSLQKCFICEKELKRGFGQSRWKEEPAAFENTDALGLSSF